jgi:hypothetical protein
MDRENTFGISSRECVRALCRVGFWVRRIEPGWTFMQKGRRVVAVPETMSVTTPLLDAILMESELTYAAFVTLLDETPTMPELRALTDV